ncbi:hypothetical protein HYS72_00080 [Candidatus Pacearchaeota archaeon]|nr:hypothetical protein [Candidatus Pacearchaeota archaeon]MBI2056878.1 hypothetical protein [Candidatus Pacearchaeota archaeon]
MTEDLKEFDKLVREKKISEVDKMLEESKKLTEKIPDLKERHEKVVIARGNVVEASIKIEIAFDELITKTGGEDLVMNPEKKEFHLITGVKRENELGGLGFKSKVDIIRKIMKKVDDEFIYTGYLQSKEWEKKNKDFIDHFKKCNKCGNTEQLNSHHIRYENFGNENIKDVEVLCWCCGLGRKQEPIELINQPEPSLLKDLEKFVALRDIFAHVPVSWFAKELEFDENPRYNHFFKLDQKWRSVPLALNEFMNLQKEILDLILAYIKSIVLKRELLKIFFKY